MCEICRKITEKLANRTDVNILEFKKDRDGSIRNLSVQIRGKLYTVGYGSSYSVAFALLDALEEK